MAILAQESETEKIYQSKWKLNFQLTPSYGHKSDEHLSLHVHFSFSTNICPKTTIMKHRICFLTEATDFSGN